MIVYMLILCIYQGYVPPCIPGADEGGFAVGIFPEGWYLDGIVPIHSNCLYIIYCCVVPYTWGANLRTTPTYNKYVPHISLLYRGLFQLDVNSLSNPHQSVWVLPVGHPLIGVLHKMGMPVALLLRSDSDLSFCALLPNFIINYDTMEY